MNHSDPDIYKQGYTFNLPKGNTSIIKVIGVGGGGNNALRHMFERGIHGVDFIICNTDAQALDNNPIQSKIQLGNRVTEGLGAGADPEVGEMAANESIDDIRQALGDTTKMVFITAGMGGGTGTGAAPVIAQIAREKGILTVGIVTIPFTFEGKKRVLQANSGLEKLRKNVDSLIVINNDKIRELHPALGFKEGFSKADEVLTNAAKGMAEVITGYFDINIDFRDAKSVLENSGTALMSTGTASGENRAEEAVKKALDSPLLNDNKISGAKDVLLLIRGGEKEPTMEEVGFINDHIQKEAGNNADIIFGVGTEPELGDSISVLVIATGFNKETETKQNPNSTPAPVEKKIFSLEEKKQVTEDSNFVAGTRNSLSSENQSAQFTSKEENLASSIFDFSDEGKTSIRDIFDPNDELDDLDFVFKAGDLELDESDDTSEFWSLNTEENEQVSFSISEGFSSEKSIFSNENKLQQPLTKHYEKSSSGFETSQEASTYPHSTDTDTFSPSSHLNISPVPPTLEEQIQPEVEAFQSSVITPATEPLTQPEQIRIVERNESIVHPDRRHKLSEYNSSYQIRDVDNDFENVPAFRRKNIQLDETNPSTQNINTYFSESSDGEIKLKENRFLNRKED